MSPSFSFAPADQQELKNIFWSWTEGLFGLFVLLLALFLGSFPARNSEVLLDLATGRLIHERQFKFGVDPFSYTTESTGISPALKWIHHSWLYDWIGYVLYEPTGRVLVLFKAIAVVFIAVCLLLVNKRHGSHGWVGLLLAALALVAMSPRFQLGSAMVSFLFFAIELILLYKAGIFATDLSTETSHPRYLWGVPILCLLWVNLDAWFLLGPVTMLLATIGVVLGQIKTRETPVEWTYIAAVTVVSWLVCLLNPQHVEAFVLPPELAFLLVKVLPFLGGAWVAGGITYRELSMADPTFSLTLSPLAPAYAGNPEMGFNFAGWSFFLLLGAAVFAVFLLWSTRWQDHGPTVAPTSLFLLLLFGALALLNARTIPFFALVAAVTTTIHLQDFLTWRDSFFEPGEENKRGRADVLGRMILVAIVPLMLLCAWPGWLNWRLGDPSSPRRVAWRVEIDPSLKETAEYLKTIEVGGRPARGFNLAAPIAHYLAWYAPKSRTFFDFRYPLFARSIGEFLQTRNSLLNNAIANFRSDDDDKQPPREWRSTFAKYQVEYVAASGYQFSRRDGTPFGGNPVKMLAAWGFSDPSEWKVLYANGESFVLAWNKNPIKNIENVRGVTRSWQVQGLGPFSVPNLWDRGTPLPPPAPGFWEIFRNGVPRTPGGVAEAEMLLEYFEMRRQGWRGPWLESWIVTGASSWATIGAGPGMLDPSLSIPWIQRNFLPTFPRARDEGPPEAPLLAFRKSHQAVAQAPGDAKARRLLLESTRYLAFVQEAHWAQLARPTALRPQVRNQQYLAALKNSLEVEPTNPDLHWQLAMYFLNNGTLDAGVASMQQAVRKLEARGPAPGVDTRLYLQERAFKEKELSARAQELQERLKRWEFETASRRPYEKFALARNLGLTQLAQKVLDEIRVDQLSADDALEITRLRSHTMLALGRAREVGEALDELRKKDNLGTLLVTRFGRDWHEIQLLIGAATGDYPRMDAAVVGIEKFANVRQQRSVRNVALASATARFVAGPWPASYGAWTSQLVLPTFELAGTTMELAELRILRGLLALERGENAKAYVLLGEGINEAGRLRFPDLRIAERYTEWMDRIRQAGKN